MKIKCARCDNLAVCRIHQKEKRRDFLLFAAMPLSIGMSPEMASTILSVQAKRTNNAGVAQWKSEALVSTNARDTESGRVLFVVDGKS